MTGDADRDIGGPYVPLDHPDYAYHKELWDRTHAPRSTGIDPKILGSLMFLMIGYVLITISKE